MVAAQDEEVLRVLDLVREQQADGFQALLTPVNVVPDEVAPRRAAPCRAPHIARVRAGVRAKVSARVW